MNLQIRGMISLNHCLLKGQETQGENSAPSRTSLYEWCRGGARKSSDLPTTVYFSVSAFMPLRHVPHLPLLAQVVKVFHVLVFPLAPSSVIQVLSSAKADHLTSSLLSLGYWGDSCRHQREGMPSPSPAPEQCKFSSPGFPLQSSCSLAILNMYHFCAASFDFYSNFLISSFASSGCVCFFSHCHGSFGAIEIPGDSASLQTVR